MVLLVLLLVIWTSTAAGLESFVGAGPLYQVLLNQDTLYLGGRNHLYQLRSRDLQLLHKSVTGPISDNHECPPEPELCTRARYGTNDDNQVMLLLQLSGTTFVLSCGSVRQGMCRLHSASDIAKFRNIGFPNDTVNFVAGRESTVAFFAPGPNQELVLYTGAEYDGRPLNLSRYAVCSRTLRVVGKHVFLELTHHTRTAVTAVDLNSDRFKRQHRVRYVYGFSHGGFSYFVTTQPTSGGGSPPETRLARVCQKDPQFFSYTEIPIRCQRTPGNFYGYASAAFLGPVGPDLGRRYPPSEVFLFISFAHSPEKSNTTSLCYFAMSMLEEEFEKVTRSCFAGEDRTHLLEAFHGQKTLCVRDTERIGKGKEVLCDYGRNLYMEGNQVISGRMRAHLEMTVTSLLVTVQWNSTVALLGTQTGHVHKLILERREPQLMYNVSVGEPRSADKSIRPSAALSPDKGTAYLLSGRRLVAFPLGSCRPYADCASCIKSLDPLRCGWCGDHCAHVQECSPAAIFSSNTCPPVIHSVSPLSGPLQGGTLLTIVGDNMGSSKSGNNGQVQVTVVGEICGVVNWTKTLISCKTGKVNLTKEGPVLVNVSDLSYDDQFDMVGQVSSEQHFSYLVPRFLGVHPLYGPSSGGTNVTISGEHLDSGAERRILLAKHQCHIWRSSNRKVECTTGPSNGSFVTEPALVCVDGACLVAESDDGTFTYRQDPEVMTIVPNTTTISGGVVLNITGNNLNSVQKPHLIVKVSLQFPTEELELIQECRHEGTDGTRMLCPTPALRNLSSRGVESTGQAPVRANMAFLMDGVAALRDLPQHRRALSLLLYYPDPKYHPFPEEGQKVFFDETEIQLQGSDLAHASQNLEVILEGGYKCNVTLLRQDSLICQLPILPDIQDTPYRTVEVISGNHRYPLGRLHFLERPEPPSTPTIAGVVISAIIVVLLLMVVAFYLRRIRWKKKNQGLDPGYMVSFSAEDPSRAQNNEYAGLSARIAAAASSQECELPDETRRLLEADNILVNKEHLTLGEIIGQGHFGCVYKGELLMPNKEDGSLPVAVKTLHNSRFGESQDMESFLQEGLLMKDFHHHNVLTLIGVCFDTAPMVVLPYMKHGDLLTYIRDEARQPMVRDLLNFAAEIAQGMRYLAELKFIHRDLAARNCMLDEDMTVKVADFGLSRDVYEREYYRGDNKKSKLPVKWMAPESLEKGTYSSKTDVWSYGVVLWELMTRGVTPYPDVDNWDILQFLKQGRRMLQPSYCPNLLYKVMLQCWSEDPIKRPTFAQLVDSVQEVILKLEQKSKKRVVGLDVTYVNYPLPEEEATTSHST